jgi:hypothetical protein
VYTTKFMTQRSDNTSLDDEMVDRRERGRALEKTEGVHDKVHGTLRSDNKSLYDERERVEREATVP